MMNELFLFLENSMLPTLYVGLFFFIFEFIFPYKKIKFRQLAGINSVDFFWKIAEKYLTPIINAAAIAAAVYFLNRYIPWFRHGNFISDIYKKNIFISYAILFLLKELIIYSVHVYMHRSKFWHIHILHHSSEHLNWLSADRVHFFESSIQFIISALFYYLFNVPIEFIQLMSIFEFIFNYLLHSNIQSLKFRVPLLNSPNLHRWHHSKFSKYNSGQNFGNITIIWDIVFGTYYLPKESDIEFGVDEVNRYPKHFIETLFYPLRAGFFQTKK